MGVLFTSSNNNSTLRGSTGQSILYGYPRCSLMMAAWRGWALLSIRTKPLPNAPAKGHTERSSISSLFLVPGMVPVGVHHMRSCTKRNHHCSGHTWSWKNSWTSPPSPPHPSSAFMEAEAESWLISVEDRWGQRIFEATSPGPFSRLKNLTSSAKRMGQILATWSGHEQFLSEMLGGMASNKGGQQIFLYAGQHDGIYF